MLARPDGYMSRAANIRTTLMWYFERVYSSLQNVVHARPRISPAPNPSPAASPSCFAEIHANPDRRVIIGHLRCYHPGPPRAGKVLQ
jgi:hypothetical protein